MRVVSCNSFGPVANLTIEERPSPPVGPGQVRIAVTASGVNFVDGLFVQGLYQIKPPVPFVPGGEVAGVVSRGGRGRHHPFEGDRECSPAPAWAASPARSCGRHPACFHTPDALTDGQAATFVQSYGTAWFALHHRAKAQRRRVAAGAGRRWWRRPGRGRRRPCDGPARDRRSVERGQAGAATAYGAEATIDTLEPRTSRRVPRSSAVGECTWCTTRSAARSPRPACAACATTANCWSSASPPARSRKLPANQILLRNRRVTGVDWGGWVGGHQAENQQLLADVLAAIGRGELHPVEPKAYALDDVATALQDQLDRKVTGKSVLVP
jgi:NADPH2:quinone reductase